MAERDGRSWLDEMSLEWRGKMPILGEWDDSCHEGTGVYRLVALDLGGAPVALPRICDEDPTGTLYIGQGMSISARIALLRRTLRPDYAPGDHPAGKRYLKLERLKGTFGMDRLATSWAQDANPEQTEARLFQSYVNAFGELPPLNRRHEGYR